MNNDLKQKNCQVSEAAGVKYQKIKFRNVKNITSLFIIQQKTVRYKKFLKTDLSSCHSEARPHYKMNKTICSHVQPWAPALQYLF